MNFGKVSASREKGEEKLKTKKKKERKKRENIYKNTRLIWLFLMSASPRTSFLNDSFTADEIIIHSIQERNLKNYWTDQFQNLISLELGGTASID